jgi:putative hemolysin
MDSKVFPPLGTEEFVARLAENDNEIEKAQRLRHRCFFEEKGLRLNNEGIQKDSYDPYADHLIVVHKATNTVVGTYRFLRREGALKHGSFYTAGEFDISCLLDVKGEILELSRTCVDASYRTRPVLHLLWRALATYIFHYDVQVLFGCGSFDGVEPQKFSHAFSYLFKNHLAPPAYRTHSLQKNNSTLSAEEEVDAQRALRDIPALLRGYLRTGAYVGEGFFVDADFQTTDICIILKREEFKKRYQEHLVVS